MANSEIKRKDLWMGLNNVKQSDWIKASEKLRLLVVKSNSGTSHTHHIRDPKVKDLNDINGLITTLQVNLYKQANQKIFQRFLKFGVKEDELWKALGKLK